MLICWSVTFTFEYGSPVLKMAYVLLFSAFCEMYFCTIARTKQRDVLLRYAYLQIGEIVFDMYSKEPAWNQSRNFCQKASRIFHIVADTTQLTS